MEDNYRRFIVSHGGRQPIVRNAFFTDGELNPWIHQGLVQDAVDESSIHEIIPSEYFGT